MPKKPKPKHLPIQPELGPQIGQGQDNHVFDMLHPAEKPHLRQSTGWVVKVSHEANSNKALRTRHEDSREAAWRGIQYKKNKYDILKHFLGNAIPDSAFVLSKVDPGTAKERYVELTMQQKVPQVSLNALSEEQRQDPRLHNNVAGLLKNMQYMYGVLGEVNARTSNAINLDAKMDLGGISDVVRGERLDHAFTDDEVAGIINSNSSPNLLVDPETMQPYCIDFDQGQWAEGMDDAKRLAFEIDARNQRIGGPAGYLALRAQ